MKKDLDWELVKAAARDLGVKPKALEKWRERNGVPPRWWLPIWRATKGKVSLEALERNRG